MLAKSSPEVGDVVSNLKLQKLLYYAAGVMTAARPDGSIPLFHDTIEAWTHGPVVPSQYFRFAGHGANGIPSPVGFDFGAFDPEDLGVLDDVYNFYGQYSAWKLRNMTHEEAPWITSYARADRIINRDQLAQFFRGELDESYIVDYREKAR